MVDLKMVVESAHLDWIKRFLNNISADWKTLMVEFCKKENLNVFLQANFDETEIPCETPQYYLDAIRSWRKFKYDYIIERSDIDQQLIWYNKQKKIMQKSVYNKRLFSCGLWVLSDLYENGKLIPFQTWIKRGAFSADIMVWMGIVKAVPQYIKNMITDKNDEEKLFFNTRIVNSNNNFICISKCQQRDVKDIIRMRKYSLFEEKDFKAKGKYVDKFNAIDNSNWKNIFTIPIALKCDNQLKELQFKILHRIFPVNIFLFKIKKVDSPKCFFCEIYDETLEHLFAKCPVIKTFWLRLFTLWNAFNNSVIEICDKDIMLGVNLVRPEENFAINLLMLYGKKFIVKCRMDKVDINVMVFMRYVQSHYDLSLNNLRVKKLETYEAEVADFCLQMQN